MAQDWDIKPRSDTCAACQTPFADGQSYQSALVFGPEGYVRADYCDACWRQNDKARSPYSTWRGVFHLPPPAAVEPLKKETAETLLRKLMESEDRSKINVIYILAVMLERKRILAERDIQNNDDGRMVRVYEHRQTGETFLVVDPRLRLDQIETVQQEVIAMLGGGQEPAAPAPVPAQNDPERNGQTG